MPEDKHTHYHIKLWPSSDGCGYIETATCIALIVLFLSQCQSKKNESDNARYLEQNRLKYECTEVNP